jgi:hypothetical protein
MIVKFEQPEKLGWLLSYYDGNNTKHCILDEVSTSDLQVFIQHLNDNRDYSVHNAVELSYACQLDSNNAYPWKVWDGEKGQFVKVLDLPCYRVEVALFEDSSDGDCITEVVIYNHLGNLAEDF